MDSLRTHATTDTTRGKVDDLSSLAWVNEELRRSLEAAHKALRRFVKESDAFAGSDVDAVDPSVLRTARQQIHQGVGALELVGLTEVASMLRASEAAVQRFVAKPAKLTTKEVDVIERASFALLDYVQRQLAGRQLSPLSLFPQYQAVQALAGADRVHPADLWTVDWRWLELPAQDGVTVREPDAEALGVFEQQLLALMRGAAPAAAARMSDLCAGLGAGASALPAATLWRLAAAFFEGLAQGLLQPDVFTRRVASRLLAQLRALSRGDNDVSERLAQDLLFFCAQSATPARLASAPRLQSVRASYGLSNETPVDYTVSQLGRYDPAWIAQARKRVAAARDAWSAVAGGEMHRLSGLAEQFSLVGDSVKRLYPSGDHLADELQFAIVGTQKANAVPAPALAMEVATSVLYLEASLGDADFDHAEQGSRVRRLAERIGLVRAGQTPPPLESWMEELYRRVSDRQTMGSVVQELHASLSETEKQIDLFFRNPAERSVLVPVPNQLAAMRGVLSVLGLDQASQAVLRMRDDVDSLLVAPAGADAASQAETFDRLAGNVGALGFLINMLSVQPQAKSLFRFDAQTGRLNPLMGRAAQPSVAPVAPAVEPRLIEEAQSLALSAGDDDVPVTEVARELERLSQDAGLAEQPELQAAVELAHAAIERAIDVGDVEGMVTVRGQLSEVLADFVSTATDPVGLEPEAPTAPVLPPLLSSAPASQATDLGDDPEMREIFLEEAREVVETGEAALVQLTRSPDDIEQLTCLRRAFHTLKGSSRMVGLKEFGEAGWAAEQVFNTWLAAQKPADHTLFDFSAQTLAYMKDWVGAIAAGQAEAYLAAPVTQAAAALDAGHPWAPIAEATGVVPASAAGGEDFPRVSLSFGDEALRAAAEVADLPEVLDLPEGVDTAELIESAAEPLPELPLDGEFDDLEGLQALPLADAATELPALSAFGDLDGLAAHEDAGPAGDAFELPAAADIPIDVDSGHVAESLDFDLDLGALDDAAADAGATPVAEATELSFDLGAFDVPEDADAPTHDRPSADVLPFGRQGASTALPPQGDDAAETAELAEPEPVGLDVGDLPALDAGVASGLTEPDDVPGAVDVPLDFGADDAASDAPVIEPLSPADDAEPAPPYPEDDHVKVVGPLRIGIPLFNIYLNEADELSRRLTTEVAEWAMELHRPVGEMPIALAHSLAGSSATVGFTDLSQLSRSVEHALMRQQSLGEGNADDGALFVDAAEEIRGLLHQFAAGFLKAPSPDVLERLAAHELNSARRLEAQGERLGQIDTPPVESYDSLLDAVPDSQPDPSEALTDEAAPDAVFADDLPAEQALLDVATKSDEAEPVAEAAPAPVTTDDASTPTEPRLGTLGFTELKAFTPIPASDIRSAPLRADAPDSEEDIDAIDAVDAELFPIFEEEAEELLPQLSSRLRDWSRKPEDNAPAAACMRTLHTLKGGARLAGAMRLGEMAHRLESAIEHLMAQETAQPHDVEQLQARADSLASAFETLRTQDAQAYAEAEAAVVTELAARVEAPPLSDLAPLQPLAVVGLRSASPTDAVPLDASPLHDEPRAGTPASLTETLELDTLSLEGTPADVAEAPRTVSRPLTPAAARQAEPVQPIDWSRFADDGLQPAPERASPHAQNQASVRVRAPLLERMVNQAGEVSITRSRIEAEVGNIRGSLTDLTDNLERLRQQLRDIEFQAEVQMSSRLEAAKAADQAFDPLESDRFTRFQELTRMMAESVNDVATVQRALQRTLETTEDELAAQGRLTRDLQDDLLRTRMVEFEGQSDRLYRVVRQAAKETGKHVRLDIVGGSIEVDRGVLDRMTPAFEHLLRNCVTHGIELPDARAQAGKDPTGTIIVSVTQEGNEVGVEFRDDGAGLDLARIREKGLASGLLDDVAASDADLANLIFAAGFSTAETVTELAGRGVGMDVVRSEVNAMGGRIETATSRGQGTSFKLVLPLTTAVTQVVMLRCGETVVAVPSTLIEIVRRATADELERAYETGAYSLGDRSLLFFWLGALLQLPPSHHEAGRMRSVVVVRSAQQRVALHVDEVLGNQEVVVKNLGPQLARLPGLAGMTLLASGAVALIYNPVALATLYGDSARAAMQAARQSGSAFQPAEPAEAPTKLAPLVLVVDDSLTVRRVTQRLLVREGYRVELAKDGMEALERLAEVQPEVVLSDIEMPRMDGFDLVRNIRADARLRNLPVIMITSRIAQKHRDHAAELGVDHYLGKPYSEEDLLALIGRYTGVETTS